MKRNMNQIPRWLAGVLAIISLAAPGESRAALKVAFIGDSITFGSGTTSPSTKSYPAAAGRLLRTNDYAVRNFGVSGTTMLKNGDRPYWNEQKFIDSTNYNPDLVVTMLGSNDSKPANWAHKAEFLPNAKELINVYKNLPSHPKVYVNTSPTVYGSGNFGITEAVVGGEVVPLQLQAARETGCPVTDVHGATTGMPQNFPDNVHPNDAGAQVIANAVYETLRAVVHNDTDAQAVYVGGWTLSSGRGFGDYQDNVHATKTNGAYVEFTFTGPRIDYVTEVNSDEGNVDVYLDNVFQRTVSCSSPTRFSQATVFSATGLAATTHTLKLVKKSGTWMLVDAFRTSLSTLNDTAATVSYAGSWSVLTGRAVDYNSDIHYTSGNGNYAQAVFAGSEVEYLSEIKSDKGNVDVYLDDVLQQTVNCSSVDWFSQVTLFRKTGLAAGTHTIKVVKRSGTYSALDAFRFQ